MKIDKNKIEWQPLEKGLFVGWTSNTKLITFLHVVEEIGASRSALNPQIRRYGTEFVVNKKEKERIEKILKQFEAWETNDKEVKIENKIQQHLATEDFKKFYSSCFRRAQDWVQELKNIAIQQLQKGE